MAEIAVEEWLPDMIDRESTPESLRTETTTDYCKRIGIPQRTYYYHCAKPDNQKKILENSLNIAKTHTVDILNNLAERAKKDNKAAEMFLDYVLQLTKTIGLAVDIKSSITKEQQTLIDKLLYAQQSSDRQDDTRNTTGESLHS